MDFGGLPVLLLGDLGQMPPVKKQALHTAAIAFANREFQEQSNEHHQLNNTVSTTVNSSHFDDSHPFAIGTKIFMKAKWFEFIEQMRSTNPSHTMFTRELYAQHVV